MLDVMTLHEDVWQALAREFRQAWQRAHGSVCGRASTLIGHDSFAVLIEDTFTRSERDLAATTRGRDVLQQYTEALLAEVCRELVPQVEEVTGCHVVSTTSTPNFNEGWVMYFFRLGEFGSDPGDYPL